MLLLPAKHRPKPHDAHEKSVGWIFGGLKEGGTPSKRASQAAPRPDPLDFLHSIRLGEGADAVLLFGSGCDCAVLPGRYHSTINRLAMEG